MNPRKKAIKELEADNFYLLRHGKNHDIYRNDVLNYNLPVKRHDFDEDDMLYLRKEIKQRKRELGK